MKDLFAKKSQSVSLLKVLLNQSGVKN